MRAVYVTWFSIIICASCHELLEQLSELETLGNDLHEQNEENLAFESKVVTRLRRDTSIIYANSSNENDLLNGVHITSELNVTLETHNGTEESQNLSSSKYGETDTKDVYNIPLLPITENVSKVKNKSKSDISNKKSINKIKSVYNSNSHPQQDEKSKVYKTTTEAASNATVVKLEKNETLGNNTEYNETISDVSGDNYTLFRSIDDTVGESNHQTMVLKEDGTSVLKIIMIAVAAVLIVSVIVGIGIFSTVLYRRYYWNKPQTLNDKSSNGDSIGYIDDSTIKENSEEMYSLDNDSFLNSLEAMTIQNYWADSIKHTKF